MWACAGPVTSIITRGRLVRSRLYRQTFQEVRGFGLFGAIPGKHQKGRLPLDRFVKETLRAKWYMRYMDDFVILAHSRLELVEQLEKITEFLHTELRLELNPKTKIYKPMHGIDFVGYRHFHDYRLIRKDSITRCRRRIRRYAAGEVSWNQLQEQLTSWTGHASHADACGIVRKIWAEALAAKAARESANKDGEAYDGARDSPRSA